MTAPHVVVVGDVTTDVVVALSGPPEPGSDRPADIRLRGGGAGANVAAWLALGGAAVHLAGRVGDDAPGRAQVDVLRRGGVNCHLSVDEARPTGTVVVLVAPDGERTMLPDRGANLGLSPDDVPDPLLRPGAHLHLSGYALLDDGPHAAALDVLDRARARALTISVDASSTGPLAALGPERFRAWTRGADWCRANAAEAALLAGTDGDPEAAARALVGDYREVVVTLGADGALWTDGGRVERVAAAPVPQERSDVDVALSVVDTTGAGDAFTAGFLAARLGGADPRSALAAGVRLGARAVARRGARPAD